LYAKNPNNTIKTDQNNRPILNNRLPLSTIMILSIPFTKKYTKYTNHSPNNISNTLDPKALLTDIFQCHFFATIIDDIRSGIEVPAANIVRPIIAWGIQNAIDTATADSTIK
jgi:hypothetical protein